MNHDQNVTHWTSRRRPHRKFNRTHVTIRKSLFYSYLDRYASLVLNMAASMIIARLLTPEDIGVFSVTMVLLTFVATVRDMGAGGYLVQEKELTVDRIRAVWSVQLGLGVGLAILVLIASVPVASFYGEPRMRDIMMVVALNYAINPFGSLTYAWQIREMRFDALALVRFTATLVGGAVSVYLAWRGFGPLGLALASVASTLVNALMAVYFRPKWFPWLPGLKEIRRVLTFGSQSTGSSMMQTLAGSAPEMLLGKLQSMVAVGLFSRASGLVAMFQRMVLDGISSVAQSWFAKQSRDYGSIAQPFMKATSYVSAVGWAFTLGIIFLAHPAIRILYGPQWGSAVELTRLLAGALACGMPAAMCTSALMAVGAVNRILRGSVFTTVVTVVLIAIGAVLGLLPMGAAMVVATIVRTWFWLMTTRKEIKFNWAELMTTLRDSAIVGLAAGVGPGIAFVLYGPYPANIWLPMAIGVPGAVAGFVGAIIVVKHPLLDELQSIRLRFST